MTEIAVDDDGLRERPPTTTLAADDRLRPYHWAVMVLGVLGYATIAADAAIFPTSYPLVQQSLGFSDSAVGYIYAGGFFTCGVIAMFLIGPLTDRFGRKPLFVAAIAICSAFTILTGFAWNTTSFGILRSIATIGYVSWGLATVLIAESVPAKHRGWMTGTVPVGWAIGFGSSAFFSEHIAASMGWRAVFWIVGILPLAFGIAVSFVIKETPHFQDLQHARRTGSSRFHIDVAKTEKSVLSQLWAADMRRRTIGVTLFFLFIVPQYAIMSYFGLSFLQGKDISFLEANRAITWANWLGIVTILAASFVTRGKGAHYTLTAVGVLGSVCALFMVYLATPSTIVPWFIVYVLITIGLWGGSSNFLQEAFPTRIRGTGGAWGSGMLWTSYGTLALIVAPLLTIYSWNVLVIVFGAVLPLIALVGLWMVPRPKALNANLEDLVH